MNHDFHCPSDSRGNADTSGSEVTTDESWSGAERDSHCNASSQYTARCGG
jgi:hypothetical protein